VSDVSAPPALDELGEVAVACGLVVLLDPELVLLSLPVDGSGPVLLSSAVVLDDDPVLVPPDSSPHCGSPPSLLAQPVAHVPID
jgi:hypothetical protein